MSFNRKTIIRYYGYVHIVKTTINLDDEIYAEIVGNL